MFDGRQFSIGGGVDIDSETITFLSKHSFRDGETIIYDNNLNQSLGISSIYQGSNIGQGLPLINNGTYYAKILNDTTIRLHNNFLDVSTQKVL